jgi:phospholipid/cholesterol/gamma-HCH transport system ATP-binding protein
MTEAQIPQQPVIEVNNLVTHYGTRKILNDVSLTIQQGEIMVIMGGSGSGKSTLLRHLVALENATSGSIKLLGNELTELDQMELYKLCRKIGVSFQGGALFSSMTVMENIILPLYEHTDLDRMTWKSWRA